jgi:hypothetical protein
MGRYVQTRNTEYFEGQAAFPSPVTLMALQVTKHFKWTVILKNTRMSGGTIKNDVDYMRNVH